MTPEAFLARSIEGGPPPSAWEHWLDPDCDDASALRDLLVPAPSKLFTFHPVSREVNNPRRKSPHLIEPLAP